MKRTGDQMSKCKLFFSRLAEILGEDYTIVGSVNNDSSMYLVPNGTEKEITYHSKPLYSFRISDHWNWKANLKRCKNEHYIQCFSKDLPWTKKRNGKGLASDPIYANSVCYFGEDGLYHVIYGEIFDRKTKKWSWIESDADDLLDSCWEHLMDIVSEGA